MIPPTKKTKLVRKAALSLRPEVAGKTPKRLKKLNPGLGLVTPGWNGLKTFLALTRGRLRASERTELCQNTAITSLRTG